MFYQIITQIGILIPVLIFMTGVPGILTGCNTFETFTWGKILRVITVRKTVFLRTCKHESPATFPKMQISLGFCLFIYVFIKNNHSAFTQYKTEMEICSSDITEYLFPEHSFPENLWALDSVFGWLSSELEKSKLPHSSSEDHSHWLIICSISC